ncbi:MAG: hypothetical protein QM758_04620 [Armatimonas sp.]
MLNLEELLPLVVAWVEREEARILAEGVPLTETQLADARAMGVTHPECVRVLQVPKIPMPDHPDLVAAGTAAGLMGGGTIGLALRYGIYVRTGAESRELLAHELVHTGQYERLGSIEGFLQTYLTQCLTVGYPAALLEQEAIRLSANLP